MHFFNTLCILVTVGLATGAPTAPESYIDVQADDDYLWNVSGWGNPRCAGTFLWSYQGTGSACVNVKAYAASASYFVTQESVLELINRAVCGFSRLAETERQPNITTVIIGGSESNNPLAARADNLYGCVNAPVMSFKIRRR